MPTENRSSNTERVSVPPYIGLEPLVGRYYPAQCRRCGWVGSSEELTKDEAQCTRDVGDRLCLGDCDELERHDLLNIIQAMVQPTQHQGELSQCEAMAAMVEEREWAEHVGTGPVSSRVEAAFTQLHNEMSEAGQLSDTLRAQLAERDALLRELLADDVPLRLAAKIETALSASAEPGAPTPQTINGHKLNCKAVDDYKPGDCSCGAEPDSKS